MRWNQVAETVNDTETKVSGTCMQTKKEYSITVNTRGLNEWEREQTPIQEALPDTSFDEREFLISGISPEGWNQLFKED